MAAVLCVKRRKEGGEEERRRLWEESKKEVQDSNVKEEFDGLAQVVMSRSKWRARKGRHGQG
jgi:hypothetical protein